MDAWLIEFVQNNFITLGLVIAVLKVIALETPWAVDDKIIQIFTEFFNRGVKK